MLIRESLGSLAAQRGEPLHGIGCMLFWAEGSRTVNSVELTNSDPALLRLFARFLRRYFDVPDDKFRVWCKITSSDSGRSSSSGWRSSNSHEPAYENRR